MRYPIERSSFHSLEWKGFLERTILYPGVHVTWAVVVLLLVQCLQHWSGMETASVQGLWYSLDCHLGLKGLAQAKEFFPFLGMERGSKKNHFVPWRTR